MRKYEIHVPLSYSDGKPIEQQKIGRVREDLVAIFGSFLVPYQKTWKIEGAKYIEIMKIEIITTSDRVPTRRLKNLKERLNKSLHQSDILILTYGIQAN